MKVISTTKKYFYLSLTFFLGALVAYVALTVLLGRQQVFLESILTKIAEQNALNDQFSSLSEVVEESKENRLYLEDRIIEGESGVVDFLSEVDRLAADFGVRLNTSDLKSEKDEKAPFGSLVVTLNTEGSFEAVNRFMYAVELLPYAKEFTNYRIAEVSGQEGVQASGMVTMRIIMK